MKVSAITNGISEDYSVVCEVLNDTGIKYAEIQNVFNKRVENITLDEATEIRKLSDKHGIEPVLVTTHAFVGIPVGSIELGDTLYNQNVDLLKHSIDIASILGTDKVRTMVFAKAINTFGYHGGDKWCAGGNKAWPKFLKLMEPIVQLADDSNIEIVVENGFNAMITSGYLTRKMMEELGNPEKLGWIWDIPNAMYYQEWPTTETYEYIKDYVTHIHIKDIYIDTVKSEVDIRPIGRGQMAPYLENLASLLRRDNFQGCVSLENIYRPDGGDFIDGYYKDIEAMKEIFS